MLSNCGMKLVPRLMVLIFTLSASFLLFQLSKCGLDLEEEKPDLGMVVPQQRVGKNSENRRRQTLDVYLEPGVESIGELEAGRNVDRRDKEEGLEQNTIRSYVQVLEQRNTENRQEIDRLRSVIHSLKLQLVRCNSSQPSSSPLYLSPAIVGRISESTNECSIHVDRTIASAEIEKGVRLNNEYEIIPFNHFTLYRIHPVDLSLGKRVVEKPIGYKRRDLTEALFRALEALNAGAVNIISEKKSNGTKPRYNLEDFVEGLYRIDPTTGTQYELYFRNTKTRVSDHVKVRVVRPFAPLRTLSVESVRDSKQKEMVHVILPLAGRTDSFRNFMDKFAKIGLKNDRRVHLTVVYFGEEGLLEAKAIMSKIVQQRGTGNGLRLLALNETFSRAKGLRVGVERAAEGTTNDVLLFMCDVDIVFSGKFLDRCRWNTKPGKQVYYPIVFSLYNPHVVYTLQGREIPPETERLIVSRDTGYWRDFGYGMTCQYRSDFMSLKGFDEDVVGWGGEDVLLYRKYVRSKIKVMRATDPGIFHLWHPKVCTTSLDGKQMNPDQYKACIRSRALNEASHAQLGFLAFREEISKTLPNLDKQKHVGNTEKRYKH